jgi:hypothetical protein
MTVPDTPNVQKVLAAIKALNGKRVEVKPMADSSRQLGSLAQHYDHPDRHEIYLGDDFQEQTLVHELLHALLREEKYPDVDHADRSRIPKGFEGYADDVAEVFANTLDHQAVYRRMEPDFDLELEPYHRHHVEGRLRVLLDDPGSFTDHNSILTEILMGLDYFLWGKDGPRVAARLTELNPDAGKCCQVIHEEVQKIGFSSAEQLRRVGEVIRQRIVEYARGHAVDARLISVWENLMIHVPE